MKQVQHYQYFSDTPFKCPYCDQLHTVVKLYGVMVIDTSMAEFKDNSFKCKECGKLFRAILPPIQLAEININIKITDEEDE